MSVLIKGFNVPKDGCRDCSMVKRGNVFDICPLLKQEVNGNVERGGKPNGCPIVEVPDRKVGKWTEKEVIHADEAKTVIEEWQSCRCSVCGRYDTRPYMYYFDEPHFCSWCGAEMRKETEDEDNSQI